VAKQADTVMLFFLFARRAAPVTSHGSTLSLITYADDQRVRELLAKLKV
jgi:hypothetical protein